MNSKHTKTLLKLINEEINSYLFEQDPTAAPPLPPDPNATPSTLADGDTGADEQDPEEKAKKKVEELSKLSWITKMFMNIKHNTEICIFLKSKLHFYSPNYYLI